LLIFGERLAYFLVTLYCTAKCRVAIAAYGGA
jgi:hypothetical protein